MFFLGERANEEDNQQMTVPSSTGTTEDKREAQERLAKSNLVSQGRRGAKLTDLGKKKIKAL